MADEIDALVAGLGNPGEQYENTPHNLGFRVIDRLAADHGIRVTRKQDLALVGQGEIRGKRVLLAKPQTFMNLSGGSVKGLLARYGLSSKGLIVVYDELALPWGALRIRLNGSDAGHRGVKSVISSVGSDEFTRVRMGINPPGRPPGDGEKFVLAPFGRARKQEVEKAVERAAAAVESILAEGVEKSMAAYNRRAQGLTNEEE